MKVRPWITTAALLLVTSASFTIGLDGCSDDGTGTIPSSLYGSGDGSSPEDPGVSTQTTPPGSPPLDATVDVATDANKPPKNPPPDAAGDGSDTDAADAGDSG
jgi:hypothetical protein